MPYRVKKQNDQFCVVNSSSGKTVACHDTRAQANAQLRALYANVKDAKKSTEPSLLALASLLRVRPDLLSESAVRASARLMAQMVLDTADPVGIACWAGLWLDAETAASLAIPGDNMSPAEELHITLLMAGDLTLLQAAQFVMAASMAARNSPPLSGRVGGQGRFWDPAGEGMDVIYAAPDVPDLEDLQGCLAMCVEDMYGVEASDNHGWTPHITLGYVESGVEFTTLVPAVPLSLGALTVIVGDWRVDLPLTGVDEDELAYASYSERARVASESAPPLDLAVLCAGHPEGAYRGSPEVRFFMDLGAPFEGTLTAAEVPPSINVLPKPGSYQHPVYGTINITRERNANFVANFNAKVYQQSLPIDAEHETKMSGALGWIVGLSQNRDGSVEASVEWTDRGRSLVAEDRFRYISPEWFEEWRQPDTGTVYQDILVGAALTTRPFFKEDSLRPLGVLVANEAGLVANEEVTGPVEGQVLHTFRFVPANGEPTEEGSMSRQDPNTPGRENPPANPPQQAAEPGTITAAEFQEMQRSLTELRAAREADQATINTLREANETERTARMATEQASRSQRYTDMALGRGGEDDGLRWAGEPRIHVNMLEMLRGASETGEEGQPFTEYVELQRSIAAQMKAGGGAAFREIGSPGGGANSENAGARALEMATKLAADRGIPMTEAQALVAKEHPELMERNRREIIDQKG